MSARTRLGLRILATDVAADHEALSRALAAFPRATVEAGPVPHPKGGWHVAIRIAPKDVADMLDHLRALGFGAVL